MYDNNYNTAKIQLTNSKVIYSELIKGKMINRYVYSSREHALCTDPLFTELRENIEGYTFQYKMIGHELIDKGDYFYLINRPAEKSPTQEAKAKLHAALICIVRLVTHEKGKLFEYLTNVNYGVSIDDLLIDDLPDSYDLILKKAKFKGVEDALKLLHEKKLMLKTNRDRYILSTSSSDIIENIVNKHL
ncbi:MULTISPECIES: condensin complex protein MksE [unclassified Colwellia]|uniref:condensin complex protein MksE n=1 Tax=unclassified Colwellia TaxID=196834 RepID=UPI0015F5BC54|nr:MULTISPECIES: hypothetical protein [unclassified Colwellia]MBA6232185.1 hypothetical protein [Colwellia sp. MB02u-7]MBA6237117.1 hypothetical protein [Colwellia sp. MB02u-11]MBA6301619.1 hypothetical protein [Colwellia sp. MB3u-22]MBA6311505.1 hypothetical protein [Colwellia sp. MB3u-64]